MTGSQAAHSLHWLRDTTRRCQCPAVHPGTLAQMGTQGQAWEGEGLCSPDCPLLGLAAQAALTPSQLSWRALQWCSLGCRGKLPHSAPALQGSSRDPHREAGTTWQTTVPAPQCSASMYSRHQGALRPSWQCSQQGWKDRPAQDTA